ncbi:MAG: putative collagen-binding domain-containing protein [Bryobacterales bacterium]
MTTEAGRILRKGDEILAVQLPKGGTTSVRLGEGDYQVQWFDPRTGGDLIPGSGLSGPGEKRVGPPPSEPGKDWVALLTQTR